MAYKLTITDTTNNLNFSVKYENLAKQKRPPVEAKAPNGNAVKEQTTFQGQVLPKGATQRQWLDEAGNIYAKSELSFYYAGDEVSENSMTKIFQITDYQPLDSYTDKYIISAYYELFPHNNDQKKDFDRDQAVAINLSSMKRLYNYLRQHNVVARGEFCVSSRGFVTSDGYVRAITFGNKWNLEIGIFKEEKIFTHLQEDVPVVVTPKPKRKRIKMV